MKILKVIFPLSFNKNTPNKLFLALMAYIVIYAVGRFIPISYLPFAISVYVFVGAMLLMIDYYVWSKRDEENKEKENDDEA